MGTLKASLATHMLLQKCPSVLYWKYIDTQGWKNSFFPSGGIAIEPWEEQESVGKRRTDSLHTGNLPEYTSSLQKLQPSGLGGASHGVSRWE